MRTPLSRRRLLQRASGALAAAALPAYPQTRASVSPMMATLSSYMSEAARRDLPPAVTEKTKQVILDTFAAMISGSQLPPGRFAIQFARAYGGARIATVAGSNVVCGPMEAALANGMLAHSDETDDTHPPSQSHPGCSIVPASLAAGEKFGVNGNRFLRAIALGYDVGTRFTATLGKLEYMTDSHRSTHSLAGIFGSAAAAGSAAGLNAQQMRWLLSYTAQQASGLASWQRDTEHVEKAFDYGGMPARDGVASALLVQAGGTGVEDVLSGNDNFFQAFLPKHDPSMVIDQLGQRFEVMRTNFKKWTVGSPIQAPLDAMDLMLGEHHFNADDVKEIVVRVAADEASIVDNREIPDICLQHMVAVMLLDKTVTFQSAHDKARMMDPAVLRQRAKVRLVHDQELERLMPRREAVVEVALNSGMRFTQRVGNVKGTVENPMTREEVAAKARGLIAPVLGAGAAEKLIRAVLEIENLKSVVELRPLLQPA